MNSNIKIGILGAGTSGAMSAVSLFHVAKAKNISIDITLIHDTNRPTLGVGESTSALILNLITDVLGFRVLRDLESLNGTLKYGTKYTSWSNKTFTVNHTGPALHVNSKKFSFWVLEKLTEKFERNFLVKDAQVLSYANKNNCIDICTDKGNLTFDYIIDCMGFPENFEGYTKPDFVSTNSVILYPEYIQTNELFTSSVAHEHGWMFGIPLTHRKTHGYLYNKNLTDKETAIKNFESIIQVEADELRSFEWEWYYKKKPYQNRVLYNGNNLFFFEPNQAFSLHYYSIVPQIFLDCILQDIDPEPILGDFFNEAMNEVQDVIALTYLANNNFRSNFWTVVGEKAKNRIQESERIKNWYNNRNEKMYFATHANELMINLIEGLNIDVNEF